MRARGRGTGAYIIAALVMLACALLPLLFMPRSQAPLPYGEAEQLGTTRSQRAELFTRYFTDGELERRGFEPTMDEREGVIACRALANSVLTGLCADSTLPEPADAQISYFSVADGEAQIRVMEFNQRWTGDWSNWFSIHIDLDTQEVYRAYISEQCLKNVEDYSLPLPRAADTAERWFSLLGCEGGAAGADAEDPLPAETTDYAQSMETDFGIHYSAPEGEALRYMVHLKYYADEYPSLIRDMMFTLQ